MNGIARARETGLWAAVPILVVPTAVVLLFLAIAPAAFATQRFADPNGSNTGTCAPPDPPCTLQRAVEDPQTIDGDEVIVNPGDYLELSDRLIVDDSITLHGADGQPFPRIVTSATDAVEVDTLATAAALVRRLTIEHSGGGEAFLLQAGTAEQIVARSTNGGCLLDATPAGTILRDSLCWVNNSPSSASAVFVSSSVNAVSHLRNVTAIATGALTQGIFVDGEGNGFTTAVDARNVIARGGETDVGADTVIGATATVTLDHSNYATETEFTGTSSVTDPGTPTNQMSSPLFADPANGNFHQLIGSPTINAGDPTATLLGTLDFDGEPRTMGVAPDIGADEFLEGGPPAGGPPAGGGSADTAPPDTQITKRPRNKTKRKRATFKFTSSEPASTFECKLDRGQFEPCVSPLTVTVKKGKHSFAVRARDAAGNVDGSPAPDSWKVRKPTK